MAFISFERLRACPRKFRLLTLRKHGLVLKGRKLELQWIGILVLLVAFLVFCFWPSGDLLLNNSCEVILSVSGEKTLLKRSKAFNGAKEYRFVGNGNMENPRSVTDISKFVNGNREDIRQTAVVNTRSFLLFADIVSVPVEAELGVVLSRKEQRRLQRTFNALLESGDSQDNVTPVLFSAIPDVYPSLTLVKESAVLKLHAREDNRLVRVLENSTVVTMTYQEVKNTFFLYDTSVSGWNDPAFRTVRDLLLYTGVITSNTSKWKYELTEPLVIHIHAKCVGAFTDLLLLKTPGLTFNSVKDAQKRWKDWRTQQEGLSSVPPAIPRRFILITVGDDDTPMSNLLVYPRRTSNISQFAADLLDHPLMHRWITQNCNSNHPKLVCVPIGVDFHTWSTASFTRAHTSFTVQQEELLWSWFIHPSPTLKINLDQRYPSQSLRSEPADYLRYFLLDVLGLWGLNTNIDVRFEESKRWRRSRYLDGDKWLWNGALIHEELIRTENIKEVLEHISKGASADKTTEPVSGKLLNDNIIWMPVNTTGEFIRDLQAKHEGQSISVTIHLITIPLYIPESKSEFFSISRKECTYASTNMPLAVQMQCFGVYTARKEGLAIRLLIPVPAIFTLALEHFRPPGSGTDRSTWVAYSFSKNNQVGFRKPAHQYLRQHGDIAYQTSANRLDFWEALPDSRFTASPVGFGYDCHRTWEALLLGSVPILHHFSTFHDRGCNERNALRTTEVTSAERIQDIFTDLPVVMVRDYREITEANLTAWQITVGHHRGEYKWERLFSQYWLTLFLSSIWDYEVE